MLRDWQLRLRDCRMSEDWDGAYNLLEQVTQGASGSELGRAMYEHAYTLYKQDPSHAPDSLEIVRDALRLADTDEELKALCLSTGIAYSLHASETDTARDLITDAGRVFAAAHEAAVPWFPHLHIWVAYYWQARGNYRLALKHLHDAVECCSDSTICALRTARTATGDVLLMSGRREEALRELRKALALPGQETSEAIAYLRGRIAYAEGRLDEAERQLRLALDSAKPNDHLFKLKVVEALVQVFREEGRLDEVSEILRPYKRSAMKGWMTRVLVRLQRLTAPVSVKGGGSADVQGS